MRAGVIQPVRPLIIAAHDRVIAGARAGAELTLKEKVTTEAADEAVVAGAADERVEAIASDERVVPL